MKDIVRSVAAFKATDKVGGSLRAPGMTHALSFWQGCWK